MNNMNNGSSKKLKIGSYSVAVIAIVLAVIVLVNLAINNLPEKFTKLSVSGIGLYDISDESIGIIEGVKDKLNIYVVSASSYADDVIYNYIAKAAGYNSKISVEKIDPDLRPTFVSQYTDETIASTDTNVIVNNPSNGRSKLIKYSDIYYKQYSDYEIQMYYYYQGYAPDNPTFFALEQLLDSAIDYVTAEKLPKIYYTTGHGEGEIDANLTNYIKAENIDVAPLDLKSADGVPSDADIVIIRTPVLDFTAEETASVKAYLENGGNVVMTSGVSSKLEFTDLTNIYGLASEYGMSYNPSLIIEGSGSGYASYPFYILPQIVENQYSSAVADNTYVILPLSHEIKVAEELPEGVTVNNLFTTSINGIVKENIGEETNLYAKEEGDREGKIVIGAEAVKSKSRFIWVASSY
ncbi:MAG: Gldg family protein, partial [Firmicutes bacterium]|nr:Gldg family protein [Candidatus Colimorpha enterica]